MNKIEQNYDALIEDEFYTPEVSVGGITGAEPEALPVDVPPKPMADVAPGQPVLQEIPRNPLEEAVGMMGKFLTSVGVPLDQVGIDFPGLGRITLKDITVGESGKIIEDLSYGFTPTEGGGLQTRLKPEVLDIPIGGAVTAGAKMAAPAVMRAVKDMPAGLSVKPVTEAEAAQMLAAKGVQQPAAPVAEGVVSTRFPTAKKATENPLEQNLVIGLDAAKADPAAFNHNVGMASKYPNFVSKATTPDAQAEDFITHVKDNLLFLHDSVPEATRMRSKMWYDGARNIATRYASEYNIPDSGVAGIMAVLSPQKDWFMNVSLGTRVLDILTKQQSHVWDSAMTKTAKRIWNKPQYAPMVKALQGKSLSDIQEPGLRAMWLRTFDEAYLPREHQIISPEGDFVGVRTTQKGAPMKTGWGSLNEIGKAVAIFDNPGVNNISINLGTQHKVRNFYNNIFAPNDPGGHVTIDTHAVAAGLLRPLSGKSREVIHNFGSGLKGEGGTKNSSFTGVQGTYPLYAEAYRRAAAERGILPREMQSITWEAVRGLFPDTFKTAQNSAQIDNIWLKYKQGEISLEEARNGVTTAAGGINPPEWERAGLRREPAPAVQPAGQPGELPGAGVPGRRAGRPRRVKPAGGNQAGVNTQQGGTE